MKSSPWAAAQRRPTTRFKRLYDVHYKKEDIASTLCIRGCRIAQGLNALNHTYFMRLP